MAQMVPSSNIALLILCFMPWLLLPLAISDLLPRNIGSILLLANVLTPPIAIFASVMLARNLHKMFWVMMGLNIALTLVMLVVGFLLAVMLTSGEAAS